NFSPNITGAFNVTKTGAGQIEFKGTSSTYSNLIVNDGTISSTTNANVLPSGAGLVVGDNIGRADSAVVDTSKLFLRSSSSNVTINRDGRLQIRSDAAGNAAGNV